MRGHTNNVSCVLFHPRHELIISNSEDRTIRIWDISKRMGVQTFRRESDRFWILAAHPEQNLLAAGHDSGMTVFKLERERPAFDVVSNKCFFIKDRYLRSFEFGNGRDVPLVSLRRANASQTAGIGGGFRSMQFNILNKIENHVLIMSDAEGGSYELLNFATDAASNSEGQDLRRGAGISATFVARDRFAVLDKTKQLLIKSFQNEVIRKVTTNINGVEQIFSAGSAGRVLLKTEDRVILYDFQARKILSEIFVTRVKYVVWNSDCSMVAFLSKHQVTIATKQLEHCSSVTETLRLKGGTWDDSGHTFIFTTSNHVKYLLGNGDSGIIRGIDAPLYPVRIVGANFFCFDREGKMRILEIDLAEPLFKAALDRKDYPAVMKMVKHSRLCGQSIISYLQEKGYPEVALHFVHDAPTRFKLALACGSLGVALQVAHELDDASWIQLGAHALKQGKFEVVEMAYQKTKQFDQLSFLYLVTGNLEKLRKMQKIAEMRNDMMGIVHNSLYLGDVEERVKVLEATGQLALAQLLASTHSVECKSASVDKKSFNKLADASLLAPCTPIIRGGEWPTLVVSSSYQGSNGKLSSRVALIEEDDGQGDEPGGGDAWDDPMVSDDEDVGATKKKATDSDVGGGDGGWADDDLDLSDDEEQRSPTRSKATAGGFVDADVTVPNVGNNPVLKWTAESTHAADHFAAGAVESAINLLNRQIAAVTIPKLRPAAFSVFVGTHGYLKSSFKATANRHYLFRSPAAKALPAIALKPAMLMDRMKQAYKAFTGAQFEVCKQILDFILQAIPLAQAMNKGEGDDLKELLGLVREYAIAVKLKIAFDSVASTEAARSVELIAYFTHCNLQPSHMILALKAAMGAAYKHKV